MPRFLSSHSKTSSQRGMTLIEILVAIVVLSIGLVGLAGLQLKGLQVNQGSTLRSQAAILTEELAELLRADRTNAAGGAYTFTGTGATPPAALAEWWLRVQQLPGGNATILAPVLGAANSVSIPISVQWVDSRAKGGAGEASSSSTFSNPGSFSVPVEL
jgi:type IV pilus assembly protein PilV